MTKNTQILYMIPPSEYKYLFEHRAFGTLETMLGLGAPGKFIIKNIVKRMCTIQYIGVT